MKIKKDTITRGIIVTALFWLSPYFKYIPIILLNLNVKNISGSTKVVLSAFSSLILVFIYYFIYRKELKEDLKKFKDNILENIDIGFKYWIIGLIIMMASNYIIRFVFHGQGANNEQAVQTMLKSFPLLMLIDGGLIAPFTEEITFRKTIKDIFKNKWIFVFLSFLLFGGAHVIIGAKTWLDYLYIIPYGSLGAALALSYYESDTIFTPLFTHMMHNTILMLLSILI